MHCTFTVRFPEVCARPSRPHRTVSRSASGLRDLSPGGTHPAHARAGRRHRARRGNGQISSAARPHVPFTITPAHVARAHRASDPRVRSTLGDPHRMCMRPGSVLQHKHGSGRAHGRSRCVLSLCCHARLSQDAQRPTGTTHTAYDMHMERRIERRRRHTYNKVLQRATHLRPTSHVVWSDPRATLPFVA